MQWVEGSEMIFFGTLYSVTLNIVVNVFPCFFFRKLKVAKTPSHFIIIFMEKSDLKLLFWKNNLLLVKG